MSGGGKKVKPTAEERELAQISSERWEDYKTRFVPVEDKAIEQVTGDLENPSDFAPSMANLGTQQAFSDAEGRLASGLTLRGAGVGSGAFSEGITGMNIDRAASSGAGQAGGLGIQRTATLGNMQTLINMGQGQANSALTGLGEVADASQRQSFIDAQASAASRAAVGNFIGTGVGVGVAANNGLSTQPQPSGGG